MGKVRILSPHTEYNTKPLLSAMNLHYQHFWNNNGFDQCQTKHKVIYFHLLELF